MGKRANILALASKISLEGMTYTGVTFNDPEYKILEPIVTDDMCTVMMHLRMEKVRTVEETARRCKKDVAFVQTQLDKLTKAGITRTRTENGVYGYYYPIWVPGIMEGILSNREQCDAYPILGACFEEYTRRRLEMLVPVLNSGKLGMSMMRVMPVMSAVENNSKVASYDELSTLIEKADCLSVGPCSCRRSRRLIGEGCGHLEEDMCMYLNDNARSMIKVGAHREITKEEAYEILKRAEANGLVHEINQTPGFEESTAICNCCSCSCYALRMSTYFRSTNCIKTNYIARVDKTKCVACGMCVENCQTNAVRLGQKCSSIDPKVSDAYNTDQAIPWDKSTYNYDFRTDRTNSMESGTSPCKAVCPLNIPVQGVLKLVNEGRYADAIELIKEATPFAYLCGTVCDRQCEKACARGSFGGSVSIADVCRLVAETDLNSEKPYIRPLLNPRGVKYNKKIAVIGAGPSGLSCAYFLSSNGYTVTVFEKEKKLGGSVEKYIPDFRLDKKLFQKEIAELKEMGVVFKTGVEVGKNTTVSKLREEGYEAFYIATGLGQVKKATDDEAVIDALTFMANLKNATVTDNVVVIGSGKLAVAAARAAVRSGAKKVTVVAPSLGTAINDAKAEGVEFKVPCTVSSISKTAKGKINAIVVAGKDGKETKIKAETVIDASGRVADIDELVNETGITVNKDGTIRTDGVYQMTSTKGIFAGGDIVTGEKDVMHAIAAGREAAISIHRSLHPGQDQDFGRDHRDYKPLNVKTAMIATDIIKIEKQTAAASTSGLKYKKSSLTEDQAKQEASRCIGCGCAVIDEDVCLGCGVCTTHCKFDAIYLEKVMDNCGTSYYKTLMVAASNSPHTMIRLAKKKLGK